jgi:capsular polysaccharide biosynthesis protein
VIGGDFGFPLENLREHGLSQLIGGNALGYARLAPGHPARGPSRPLWPMPEIPSAVKSQDPAPIDLVAIPNVEIRSDFMAYVEGEPICGLRLFQPYVPEHFRSGRIKSAYKFPETTDVIDYDRPAFIITNFNQYTYGHFLLEVMPKAFVVRELYAAGYSFPIVWPQSMSNMAPVFKAIHPDIELLYYDDKAVRLQVPLGLFPSAMTSKSYDFHEIFIAGVRTLARSTGVEYAPRRLFISRQNWRSFRQLKNENELADIAAANGFEIVQPQKLPWIEQVRLFAQASHVIGEFTSALHNTMFCSAAAKVVALNKFGNAQTAIADSIGHSLGYILPSDGVPRVFIRDWTKKEPQRFTINKEEFCLRLEQALAP